MNKKVRVIAHYLPQFHPIPENDEWWGKGFTDWINVGKAKPLFLGHYQPRVPADLGYYDLRVNETRIAQADMAKEHGVEGFCYWHYWFGNGKRLLERPLNEIIATGKPNFPFCLGWANHSWLNKNWSYRKLDKILIKQSYNGNSDYEEHFRTLLPAFNDHRYITVEGRLFFLIFRPLDSPEISTFIKLWQKLAKEHGFNGFYFVGQGLRKERNEILKIGFDAFSDISIAEIQERKKGVVKLGLKIKTRYLGQVTYYNYKQASDLFVTEDSKSDDFIPFICPNWDHSPRSGKNGFILHGSTPQLFKKHVKQVFNQVKDKPIEKRIVMLKSWNEWAEGNYIEPDLKYGKGYLEAVKESIEESF